ncbi:YggS family pyridoxal phosphate-dependent enzyme [Brachybacterium hainanense]|uniref:Pyridoxal phosphate homeostasis protein n=1 Tax=Brachybacterium hainanense TaxID=1541174 RepID=A0ABV6RG42_9MICO
MTSADLSDRLRSVLSRIDAAAARAGRDPQEIRLLLATKTRSGEEIARAVDAALEAGRTVIVGENRAQEIAKYDSVLLARLEARGVERHFIGRLQTNKARDVIAFAQMIHSVDRPDIIEALERRARTAGLVRDVLVQVNTSGEESKGGYAPEPEAIAGAVARLREGGVLRPAGLMTIGANTSEDGAVRASLGALRRLRDELADPQLVHLSMGMSGDLEIAVEEGASIVRVGSAIFGPRPAP